MSGARVVWASTTQSWHMRGDVDHAQDGDEALPKLLAKGWRIVSTTAVPADDRASNGVQSGCYFVLEPPATAS